jgi:hypothetical protein
MLRLATPLSVFAIAGASFALAACGSSSDSNSSTGSSATAGGGTGTQNAAFQKYQQCLKDNGVTLPTRRAGQGGPGGSNAAPPNTNGTPPQGAPGAGGSTTTPPSGTVPQGTGQGNPGFFGGGGANSAKFQKAMKACASLRPKGAAGGGYGGFRGGGGTANGNGAGTQQNIRAFTPYLTCLRDRGLDVKVSDGFNALRNLKQSDPKVQAAFKSCQSKLPQRPQAGGSNAAPANTTTS